MGNRIFTLSLLRRKSPSAGPALHGLWAKSQSWMISLSILWKGSGDVGDLGLEHKLRWMKTEKILFDSALWYWCYFKCKSKTWLLQLVHLSRSRSGWGKYKCKQQKCCDYSSYMPRRLVNLVWLEQRPQSNGSSPDYDFSVSLKLFLHIPWFHAYCLRRYLPPCLRNSPSPDILVTAWRCFLIKMWQKHCPWDISCFQALIGIVTGVWGLILRPAVQV